MDNERKLGFTGQNDFYDLVLNLPNADLFDIVDKDVVDKSISVLMSFDKLFVPNDYSDLMQNLCDGFAFDGITLCGFNENKSVNGKIVFPSIVDLNQIMNDFKFFDNKLIVGTFFAFYICFSYETNKYYIINNMTFGIVEEFDNLEDLIVSLVSRRADG